MDSPDKVSIRVKSRINSSIELMQRNIHFPGTGLRVIIPYGEFRPGSIRIVLINHKLVVSSRFEPVSQHRGPTETGR